MMRSTVTGDAIEEESAAMGQPTILKPRQGRAIPLGNFAMTLKASGDDTRGAFTLLEADEPPGFGPPMHIHRDCDEAFYVVAGEYHIFIGDDEHVCPAGSFVFIPQDTVHGFRVGDVASRKLNLYAPAAMVGYFDDLSAAIERGAADEELAGIAERHGVEVTGPVPEGYV
jgi:mannose-6-phosphate isomerase-like protein (cupin superfamily)